VNVRANCASIIDFTTSSCRMHWSTCCKNFASKACVSTPDGRGHSWPPSAVGKVYREFALDHGTCHAFLYACTQIFYRPSNSLFDHSMRAAETGNNLLAWSPREAASTQSNLFPKPAMCVSLRITQTETGNSLFPQWCPLRNREQKQKQLMGLVVPRGRWRPMPQFFFEKK